MVKMDKETIIAGIFFMVMIVLVVWMGINANDFVSGKDVIGIELCKNNDLNYDIVTNQCYKQTGDFVEFFNVVDIDGNYYIREGVK